MVDPAPTMHARGRRTAYARTALCCLLLPGTDTTDNYYYDTVVVRYNSSTTVVQVLQVDTIINSSIKEQLLYVGNTTVGAVREGVLVWIQQQQ